MRLKNGEVLLRWPLSTHIITAGWTYNDGSAHNAIDLRAAVGTPVYAAEDGTVDQRQIWDEHTRTGMMSYGSMLRLLHSPYNGGSLRTRYGHLSKILVRQGEAVKEGQLIAYSGDTGNVYGAHLHFETIYNGNRVNPLNWMDGDFECANNSVKAHLGSYTSVVVPTVDTPATDEGENKLQRLTIGPVDNSTAMLFWGRAQGMQVGYDAQYMDDARTMQMLTIGPVSIGDAMQLWQMAKDAGAEYKSEYVDG